VPGEEGLVARVHDREVQQDLLHEPAASRRPPLS
jgi:hypothetical protein